MWPIYLSVAGIIVIGLLVAYGDMRAWVADCAFWLLLSFCSLAGMVNMGMAWGDSPMRAAANGLLPALTVLGLVAFVQYVVPYLAQRQTPSDLHRKFDADVDEWRRRRSNVR